MCGGGGGGKEMESRDGIGNLGERDRKCYDQGDCEQVPIRLATNKTNAETGCKQILEWYAV